MLYRILKREIASGDRQAGAWQVVVVTVKRRKKILWTKKDADNFMKEWAPRMALAGGRGVAPDGKTPLPRWEFKAELIETRHGLPPRGTI